MKKLDKVLYRITYQPYLLQRLADGSWVEINRDYKPLAVPLGRWIDYEQYPFRRKVAAIAPELRKELDIFKDGSGDKLYLYHDGCIPTYSKKFMAAYERRLNIIDSLPWRNVPSPLLPLD